MIKFTNEKTNKQVFNTIYNHTKSFDLEQLVNESRVDLFHMDNAIETLYFATITGQNAILYGPGGYGKSRVIKYFYKKLGIPVYTKVCNSSTTVEELLGIPDMNKLMNNSEYSIAFEKTIFNNKGILFLEEGLDMQPDVAAALKDILTTKGHHDGNKIVPSFITSVVIATNKNPYECALDDSTAAFYEERFPHVKHIGWDNHSFDRYKEFLTHNKKLNLSEDLSNLLASLYQENKLSPRKVLNFTKVIQEMGIQYIEKLSGLNTDSIKKLKEKSLKKATINKFTEAIDKIENIIVEPAGQSTDVFRKHIILSNALDDLKLLKCPEDLFELKNSWTKKGEKELAKLWVSQIDQ